ncbi:hypothetical protein T08_13268 [Trichinella sp. T8]|nr:hypothetical protein T08_13268 [Trichinella sp. T8]
MDRLIKCCNFPSPFQNGMLFDCLREGRDVSCARPGASRSKLLSFVSVRNARPPFARSACFPNQLNKEDPIRDSTLMNQFHQFDYRVSRKASLTYGEQRLLKFQNDFRFPVDLKIMDQNSLPDRPTDSSKTIFTN